MAVKNPKGRRFLIAATLGLLLLGWGVAGCFRDGYRHLADLKKATGKVRQVSIQRTQGKNAYAYLAFIVGTNPHPFGIRAADSEQPLTHLQQQMLPGAMLTVYYTTPRWEMWPANFEVYQVEDASHVFYAIEEVRQRALNHGAWALIGWLILAVVLWWMYWQQRSAFISEF